MSSAAYRADDPLREMANRETANCHCVTTAFLVQVKRRPAWTFATHSETLAQTEVERRRAMGLDASYRQISFCETTPEHRVSTAAYSLRAALRNCRSALTQWTSFAGANDPACEARKGWQCVLDEAEAALQQAGE